MFEETQPEIKLKDQETGLSTTHGQHEAAGSARQALEVIHH